MASVFPTADQSQGTLTAQLSGPCISSDKPALASSTDLHLLLYFSIHHQGRFFQEAFLIMSHHTQGALLHPYWVTAAGERLCLSFCMLLSRVYLLSHTCWGLCLSFRMLLCWCVRTESHLLGLCLSFHMLLSRLCIVFAFLCASLAHRGKVCILYILPVCTMLLNTGKETVTEIISWLFCSQMLVIRVYEIKHYIENWECNFQSQ